MMEVYTIWWEVIFKTTKKQNTKNTVSLVPYRVGFGEKRGNSGVYILLLLFFFLHNYIVSIRSCVKK